MSVVLFLSSLSSSGNQRQVLALPHLHSIWQLDLHIWASFLCGEKGGRSALWPLGARVPHNVPPPPFHISSALPVPGGRHIPPPPQLRPRGRGGPAAQGIPPGQGIRVPMGGPRPVCDSEREGLQGQEPAGDSGVGVLIAGHPYQWCVVGDQGELPSQQIILQLLNCPFYSQTLFFDR